MQKKIGVATALFLAIAVCSAYVVLIKAPLPKRQGILKIAGLKEQVEASFDKWGVPHIYAQNEEDMYRALGYLHAQDRLFQMEMLRRLAKGELSEIVGKKALTVDKLHRTLQIKQRAQTLAKRMKKDSPVTKAARAYLGGLNTFIEKGPTPLEFQVLRIPKTPFSITDSFAIAGLMSLKFSKALATDPLLSYVREELGTEFLKDFGVDLPKLAQGLESFPKGASKNSGLMALLEAQRQSPFYDAVADPFDGSNAWVISGAITQSGKPILASDPHIRFSAPSVWYEAHLQSPGFEIYGHHIAAIPMALLGHNSSMGWGITMLQNKDIRLYREKSNPDNSQEIWTGDSWTPIKTRKEFISVRGSETFELDVKTVNGRPIIPSVVPALSDSQDIISIDWSFSTENNRLLEAFYELPRSSNMEEAERAVSKIKSPGLNILYANSTGDIAWWAAAGLPQYEDGKDPGTFILDGNNPQHKTQRKRRFEGNPQSKNPKIGFIVSANNKQVGPSGSFAGYFSNDNRFARITKRLDIKKRDWTLEDMKSIQQDTISDIHREASQRLTELLQKKNIESLSREANQALTRLSSWKGNHDLNSVGATIYHEFEALTIKDLFSTSLPKVYFDALLHTNFIHSVVPTLLSNASSPWWKNRHKNTNLEDHLALLWQKTITSLKNDLGKDVDNWTWDRVNHLEHPHPLGRVWPLNLIFNIGPYSVAGGSEIVLAHRSMISQGVHKVIAGPSTRRLIDFAKPESSLGINPVGQSGHLFDQHQSDQSDLYVKGEYRHQLLKAKAELQKDQVSTLIMQPE